MSDKKDDPGRSEKTIDSVTADDNDSSSVRATTTSGDDLIPLVEALSAAPGPSSGATTDESKILQDANLAGIKRYIEDGKCRNIIVMAGAGISTSAGIPDFRSPTCGLYAKIQQTYKLSDPQQMFEIGYFKKHPKPFYTLAKDLLPEGFHPTPSHYFVKLLHDKGLLLRHYTQNVDGLERLAGIPDDKIVEAHGSFHLSHCTSCGKEYSFEWMREKIRQDVLPICSCNSIIKPDIIFFGEALPPRFFHCASQDFGKCDLLLIMGTSLVVQPFASLVDKVRPTCPRVLINREKVCSHNETSFLARLLQRFTSQKDFDKTSPAFGALLGKEGFNFEDSQNKDVALLGDCDDQVRKLAEAMGWASDLQKLIDGDHGSKATTKQKQN